MDELDNNKLKAEDDEREVESEENQRGEEIEVNEDRLPSRAMAIHEHIRQEGEKEMERDALALLFIIVIMARQQLFTENTVTAVLPVMHNPTLGNVGLLMRLWSVVLAGNLIGTAVAAWAFNYMPIFDEPTRQAFVSIAEDVMKNSPTEIIALADTTHIVVGSVEILYLVFNGNLPWSDFIWPFALPTLAGNICGGTFIFALLSHAQIRNDMSSKRKAEARAQAAEKGKKADRA